jgi:hypothetical protein
LDEELPVLFPDLVRPFARGVLGRLDLLPSLTAQDADEAANRVRLPACSLHDLGQRYALRALIIAITSAFLLVRSPFGFAVFLARPGFFAGLAVLAGLRPLVAGASVVGVLVFSESLLMLISP